MKLYFLCFLVIFLFYPILSSPSWFKNVTHRGMHYLALNQGFPNSNSIWSSIGITKDDIVYVGAADHALNVGLFKYDAKKDKMTYLGDVLGNGKLGLHQWQGKIHTRFEQNPNDGLVYFGTDAGNMLWEYSGIPEQNFEGGHWFSINPKTDEVRDLGVGCRYLGLKSIAVDPVYNRLFATTDPSSHFIVYDINKGKSPDFEVFSRASKDYGWINGAHEPRMVWVDKWGNAYTSNHIGQIVKFIGKTGELKRLDIRLPYAMGTAMYLVSSGAAAIVHVNGGEYVYGGTYYGRLFKYIPEKNGPGKMIDLGASVGSNERHEQKVKTGSLALGHNGKLYYTLGGHGRFITKDKCAVLFELDPDTKKRKAIYKFKKLVSEGYAGVTDSKGNIYFGAHGGADKKLKRPRKPWLIKFHPSTLKRMVVQ
jgi:hypothetical protein